MFLDSLGCTALQDFCLQVARLQQEAAKRKWDKLEVLTIDKCQGIERPVLLLSLVRSNAEHKAGELLRDWRRINVALTRAQQKMVMIGSASTLRDVPLFDELLAVVQAHGWLLSLPSVSDSQVAASICHKTASQ